MSGRTEQWQPRWEAIRAVLGEREIRSQDQLLRALRLRGFTVTQSSVSRDLREMGVAKVEGRYVLGRDLAAGPPGAGRFGAVAGFLVALETAGPNLLVARTTPGAAQTVALAIDTEGWPEVVGTVAGDDTLFLAVRGRSQQARVEARVLAFRKEQAGD
jgi:transcriptional regulator of arginine metabolism